MRSCTKLMPKNEKKEHLQKRDSFWDGVVIYLNSYFSERVYRTEIKLPGDHLNNERCSRT